MNRPHIDALIEAEALPSDYRQIVERWWVPLADEITRRAGDRRPLIVGVNGAQGSGKSTLCKFLEPLLGARGLRTITFSLDDLYLSKAQRFERARTVHPLLATRGVPGTHAIDIGLAVLATLRRGQSFRMPRFDKALDERNPVDEPVQGSFDILLFEGWCVGAVPQPRGALLEPINQLEAIEDPDGTWRHFVNDALAGSYRELFSQLDLLLMLKVPDFDAVRQNRALQESKLRERRPNAPGLLDGAALERFLAHYERLTRWMLAEMPSRADILIEIGSDHRPCSLRRTASERS